MNKYKAIKVNGVKCDEHRYLMEQALGRKLDRNEVVHHKDGDKANNDLANLEIVSRSKHSKEHRLGKKTTEETKQKISDKLKGHKSSTRKLSDSQIEQIKALHEDGYSNRRIAGLFNVHHQTINDIINGIHYKNQTA